MKSGCELFNNMFKEQSNMYQHRLFKTICRDRLPKVTGTIFSSA